MRSTDTAQRSATIALLLNGFFCAAVLVVLRTYGMPFAEMLASGFEARPRVVFFLFAFVLSVGGALALVSSKALGKAYRVAFLLVWMVLGGASLKYGSIMLVSWAFAAWRLWRFANEKRA